MSQLNQTKNMLYKIFPPSAEPNEILKREVPVTICRQTISTINIGGDYIKQDDARGFAIQIDHS